MESFLVRPYEMDYIYSLNEERFGKEMSSTILEAMMFCLKHMPLERYIDTITTKEVVTAYTDASLTHMGWCRAAKKFRIKDINKVDIYKCTNVMIKFSPDEREYGIRLLEALALYYFIKEEEFKTLLILVDNQNVIANMRRTAKQTDPIYMSIIKGINRLIESKRQTVVINYVKSKANRADIMTREDLLLRCKSLKYNFRIIKVDKVLDKINKEFEYCDI